jgi:predicted PurR-regulated permease PerM
MVTTFLCLLIGNHLLGLFGMIIAIPAYLGIRTVVLSIYRSLFLDTEDA